MQPMQIATTAPKKQYIVYFDDVLVPPDAVVGAEGNGTAPLFSGLNPERVLAAAQVLGLGAYALEKGVEYARTRAPFDRPIGSYQAVQHPLARAYVEMEAARLMTYSAAAEIDRGGSGGLLANGAKLLASEAAFAAVDASMQVHGGASVDRETDLLALCELIRLMRIAPVTNEMVLNYVAQVALNLPRSY
jgi:alkylation response protein AidB-like acyl-CoA dehydrogenase